MNLEEPLQPSLPVLFKISAVACALLFSTAPTFGYCFPPDPTVACEFLDSDAVFVGTVISERDMPARDEVLDGWLYTLTVQESFRGPRTRTIAVFSENSDARFRLEVAQHYLLFAQKFDGQLTISNCGNSALLSQANNAVRELRTLQVPEDAEIEGRISFSGIPDSGPHISGIQVIIRGEGRTLRATSDRNGWFHLHVPPGNYSAEVEQTTDWVINPFDLSHDNPKLFKARAGHCSRMQFVAHSNHP